MPRSEDIERFTQVLNSLGDEPAIRAARSETIEDVPAPGEEAPAPESGELDSLDLGDPAFNTRRLETPGPLRDDSRRAGPGGGSDLRRLERPLRSEAWVARFRDPYLI